MQIEKDRVVAIQYTLKDDDGTVLDASTEDQPLEYLHGAGNIIPGLEKALEGRDEGEQLSVNVPPEEAYGERDDNLKQEVSRELFQGVESVEPGMRFQAQTQAGVQIVTVTEVEGESVTVDANHPLAGQALNFEVAVDKVREATDEEKAAGQVQG